MRKALSLSRLGTLAAALAFVCLPASPVEAADEVSEDETTAEVNAATDLTVVVTASRIPQSLLDVPVGVEVVGREQLEEAGADTVGDALRLATGATVRQNGSRGSAQSVSVRGSTSQQVLILVDGLPVVSPQGSFNLAHIPVADIERIEVVKGPGSALYGADAVGGVVNVITSSAAGAQGLRVDAKGGAGDLDLSASYGGRLGDAHYSFTVGHVDSAGFRPNSDYAENHVRLRLDREMSAVAEAQFEVSWLTAETEVPNSTEFFPSNGSQSDQQVRTDLVYYKDFSQAQLRATLYGRQYEQQYDDIFGASHHDTLTLGGEVQTDFYLDTGVLTFGAAARTDRAESTDLQGGEQSASSGALFGQVVRDLSPKASLTAGVRVDAHSVYDAPVSPRVGVQVWATPDTTLRASAGRSFRAPTLNDLYWTDAWGNRGKPDLKPEDGWSYELGLRHDFQWGEAELAAFRRRIDNLIQWPLDANGPRNVAESETDGVELTVRAPLAESLRATFGWTVLDAQDLTAGTAIAHVPTHEGRLGLQYNAVRTSANLEFQHRGARPTGTGSELRAHTLVNGRVSRVVSPGLDLFVEGKNLLDAEYEEQSGFPMPGRTVWFGIAYDY